MSACKTPVTCGLKGCLGLCAVPTVSEYPIGMATELRPRQRDGSRAQYRVLDVTGTGIARRALLRYRWHIRPDGKRSSESGLPASPIWASAARFHIHYGTVI